MGIHVTDPGAGLGFDPDRPQMILFAKDGGELISRDELGQCVDGAWTGEPQGGVFAMYNPSMWPIVYSADEILSSSVVSDEGTVAAPILNFDFGDIDAEVGETTRFGKADSVPHTVTAETGDFDSGVLGPPTHQIEIPPL